MTGSAWFALYMAYGLMWFWLGSFEPSAPRKYAELRRVLMQDKTVGGLAFAWSIAVLVIGLYVFAWPIMLPLSQIMKIGRKRV